MKRLGELIDRAAQLGVPCSAAFAPPVLLDPPAKGVAWQRLRSGRPSTVSPGRARDLCSTPRSSKAGRAASSIGKAPARSLLEGASRRAPASARRPRPRWGASGPARSRPSRSIERSTSLRTTWRSRAPPGSTISPSSSWADFFGDRRAAPPPPEAWLDAFVETPPARVLPELPVPLRALLGAGAFAARLLPGPSW